jgi:hypothetical protein
MPGFSDYFRMHLPPFRDNDVFDQLGVALLVTSSEDPVLEPLLES